MYKITFENFFHLWFFPIDSVTIGFTFTLFCTILLFTIESPLIFSQPFSFHHWFYLYSVLYHFTFRHWLTFVFFLTIFHFTFGFTYCLFSTIGFLHCLIFRLLKKSKTKHWSCFKVTFVEKPVFSQVLVFCFHSIILLVEVRFWDNKKVKSQFYFFEETVKKVGKSKKKWGFELKLP